jgi:pimeloyl-ACP methyl ester carboxylesterase
MATPAWKKSLVRTERAAQLFTVRLAFGVLERLAPELGARWAAHLWFSVPAQPKRRRNLPTGDRFELPVNGGRIVGEFWGEGAAVILMHGWGGGRSDFAAMVDPLVAAGYRVVAFDAPGHGESDAGSAGLGESTILEFSDALSAVCHAFGPSRAVIAHSLGCMAAAVSVRERLSVPCLVLIAPMAEVRPYTAVFARQLGFGERILSGMIARIERRVATPLSVFDIPAMACEMATPPVLLVHDREDPETRFSDSVAIAEAWCPANLVATVGLGHRRILLDCTVLQEVVSFVAGERLLEALGPGHIVAQ